MHSLFWHGSGMAAIVLIATGTTSSEESGERQQAVPGADSSPRTSPLPRPVCSPATFHALTRHFPASASIPARAEARPLASP